jgi:hypothetical protein
MPKIFQIPQRASAFASGAIMALLLSGCVAETSSPVVKPAAGVSAKAALEEFVLTLASAEFIDDRCRTTGLRKAYSSPDHMIMTYATGLVDQGYSLAELDRVLDTIVIDDLAAKGFGRLKAKGVKDGDDASVCRVGRAEIAADTAIGRLLRDGA